MWTGNENSRKANSGNGGTMKREWAIPMGRQVNMDPSTNPRWDGEKIRPYGEDSPTSLREIAESEKNEEISTELPVSN